MEMGRNSRNDSMGSEGDNIPTMRNIPFLVALSASDFD
jgi:hypothetical protein